MTRRHAASAARAACVVLAMLVTICCTSIGARGARTQTDENDSSDRPPTGIVIDELTPRVAPGDTLRLAVRIRPNTAVPTSDAGALRVTFRFGDRVRNSAELQDATAADAEPPDGPSFSVTPTVDPDGTLRASIERRVVQAGRSDSERVVLSRPGVYPVGIVVGSRDAVTPSDVLMTSVIRSGDVDGEPLRFAWVWPLHVAPPPTPDADDDALASAIAPGGELRRAVDLAAATGLPLTLAPTPDTVARVAATAPRDPGAATVIDGLRSIPRRHQIVGGPYALLAADSLAPLGQEALAAQFGGGERVRAGIFGEPSGPGEQVLLQERVPTSALDLLYGAGARNVVVPPGAVRAAEARVPITRPFRVPDTDVRVIRADPDLATDLVAPGGPIAAAQRIAAQLTVVQAEAPQDVRGLVLLQPAGVAPSAEVLAEVERRVTGTPVIAPVTVRDFAAQAPDLTSQRRKPLSVALTVPDAVPGRAATSVLNRIAAATSRAALLTSVTARPVPEVAGADRNLLVAPSAELIDDPAESIEWFAPAAEFVTAKLDGIRVLRQPVTLTSRTGELPITVVNESGLPLRVRVSIASDTVQIKGPSSKEVTFDRRSTAVDFTVAVTSTGPFDVRYTVTPVGPGPALETGTVQVSSTAVNGVAVFLSIGSIVFLAVWWVFSARRRRGAPPKRRANVHVHIRSEGDATDDGPGDDLRDGVNIASSEPAAVTDDAARDAAGDVDASERAGTRPCDDESPEGTIGDGAPTEVGPADGPDGPADGDTPATPARPPSPS